MNALNESELQKLKASVKPLIENIRRSKGMTIKEIASAIGYKEKLASFYKWAAYEGYVPNNYEIKVVVERLEKLLERFDSDTLTLKEDDIKITEQVTIYFDANKKTEIYTGEDRATGVILNIKGYQAIIAYQNNTSLNRNADGLIYLHDAGVTPYIKYGSLIAIRKINKEDWRPGYYYLVIDTSDQMFARKLFAGENKEEVRLVSENVNNYPDFTLSLNKIVALFRIEKVTADP
jgi:hypothetical protein